MWMLIGSVLALAHSILASPGAAAMAVSSTVVPIELTLRVHETRIKAGDFPWVQIQLRNVGPDTLWVPRAEMFEDFSAMRRNLPIEGGGGQAIYIEVRGPDGKSLDKTIDLGDPIDPENIPAEEGPDLSRKKTVNKLRPGEAIATKPAFAYGPPTIVRKAPQPATKGDFARLEFFEFARPGTYKIRAVYDLARTPDETRRLRRAGVAVRKRQADVRVVTSWAHLIVLP